MSHAAAAGYTVVALQGLISLQWLKPPRTKCLNLRLPHHPCTKYNVGWQSRPRLHAATLCNCATLGGKSTALDIGHHQCTSDTHWTDAVLSLSVGPSGRLWPQLPRHHATRYKLYSAAVMGRQALQGRAAGGTPPTPPGSLRYVATTSRAATHMHQCLPAG